MGLKEDQASHLQAIVWGMLKSKGRSTIDHADEYESTDGTGERWVRAFDEMTVGYERDPKQILSKRFPSTYDQLVTVTGIQFSSLCEHHLLPFFGVAHVAYLPNIDVVGLSKLARLVECFALRLQIQERMTMQIADAIMEELTPRGVACVIEATHSCMACRGVRKTATMRTSAMLGMLRDRHELRAEFFSLIHGG